MADIRNVVAGDPSPDGKGAGDRARHRGRARHPGTKYSRAMNALDEDGKPKLFEMGCYGIGITRSPAAPSRTTTSAASSALDAIAPFTVVVCPIGMDRSPRR